MKHLALLKKLIREFKEKRRYIPVGGGKIDEILEPFSGEEDRNFTPIEKFNYVKFLILNEQQPNIRNFLYYAKNLSLALMEGDNFLEDFTNLLPEKLDTEMCSLLEKLALFNIENCKVLVEYKEKLAGNLSDYKIILQAIVNNGMSITSEIFFTIIQSFNFKRILLILIEPETPASEILEAPESKLCIDNLEKEKNKLPLFAKKNVELVLRCFLKCRFTEEDFQEIYSDLFDILMPTAEAESQTSLEDRHQKVHTLIYDRYFYMVPENQTSSVSMISDTIKTFPNVIIDMISQYAFFRPPQTSFIPVNNLISSHFTHEAEDKKYHRDVDLYKTKIENFGSFATQFSASILASLGVNNKVYSIVLGSVTSSFDFLERLTDAWPSSNENYCYVGVIVPTFLVNEVDAPGHATLLLFDLNRQTVECIDSLGPQTKSINSIEGWVTDAKRFDPSDEDLDPDDLEDLKRINKVNDFCKRVFRYSKLVVAPMNTPIQQTDHFSCVLHSVANMVGMVLYKEDKKPDPNCDKKTKAFINSLYIDLKSGFGIAARSPQMLHDLAGVIQLAGQQIHIQQVEVDVEKSVPSFGLRHFY
jgi:hypothetical protein